MEEKLERNKGVMYRDDYYGSVEINFRDKIIEMDYYVRDCVSEDLSDFDIISIEISSNSSSDSFFGHCALIENKLTKERKTIEFDPIYKNPFKTIKITVENKLL